MTNSFYVRLVLGTTMGFPIYPTICGSEICIQMLPNAILLKGVPKTVTRVYNKLNPLVLYICIIP